MDLPEKEEFEKYRQLATDISNCIMVTYEGNQLHGRPMETAHVDMDGTIWFFTNEYSEKVDEVIEDQSVFLTYSNPSKHAYLVVSGKALLSKSRNKMEEFWSPLFKTWFPDGLDDPQMALLQVIPKQAEYWDHSNNRMIVLINMFRSLIKSIELPEADHGKFEL